MTTLQTAFRTFLLADATLMTTCDQVLDADNVGVDGLKFDHLQDDASANPFAIAATIYVNWTTINRLSNLVEQDEEGFVELYFYATTYAEIATMRERVRALLVDGVEIGFDEPTDGWQCGFFWAGGDILRKTDPALANTRFERSRYRYMNIRSLA